MTEKFREAVKAMAQRERIPVYQFHHKECKDDAANDFRRKRGIRDGVVFVGVAPEKAQAFQAARCSSVQLRAMGYQPVSERASAFGLMPSG